MYSTALSFFFPPSLCFRFFASGHGEFCSKHQVTPILGSGKIWQHAGVLHQGKMQQYQSSVLVVRPLVLGAGRSQNQSPLLFQENGCCSHFSGVW